MLKIRFREMEEEDLKQVLCIERQSFPSAWSSGLFLHEMKNSMAGTMVAEAETEGGSEILGYTCFWRIGEEIHITNIAVDPRYRRKGVGEQMLKRIMVAARDEGVRAMTLEVRVSNVAAQSMYRKLGFVSLGVRKRYYSDNGEDAIIMTLEGLEGSR